MVKTKVRTSDGNLLAAASDQLKSNQAQQTSENKSIIQIDEVNQSTDIMAKQVSKDLKVHEQEKHTKFPDRDSNIKNNDKLPSIRGLCFVVVCLF